MPLTVPLYLPFSLPVSSQWPSWRGRHSLHLLPFLHNDMDPSSQGAAEWWDRELWSGVQRWGQQQYSGEHNTRHEVHCRGPDNWQSVPVQSSSYYGEWNGTILRVGKCQNHSNRYMTCVCHGQVCVCVHLCVLCVLCMIAMNHSYTNIFTTQTLVAFQTKTDCDIKIYMTLTWCKDVWGFLPKLSQVTLGQLINT